ncbi:MAG TPA: hypothetical protein P5277_01870 [Candidatus Paceibacterota bacterium]|nr:hypothetical protein [Candidatus Paceibacterota bacterium]
MKSIQKYKGCIVEESLTDNQIINKLNVKKITITRAENPSERWHIYNVIVDEEDINKISENIKPGWYMHFWKGNDIIVIFKDKQFKIKLNDKSTWKKAVDYGISIKIPKEQLDFKTEF